MYNMTINKVALSFVFSDAQHGGDKLGQLIQANATEPSQVKILLEEFAGDCVANWVYIGHNCLF